MIKKIQSKKYFLLLLTVLSVFLAACSGTNKFYKRGTRLAEAGFHKDAADFFMRSAAANRSNVEARVALQKSGQITLDKMFDNFFVDYGNKEHKKVIDTWLAAESYKDRVTKYGAEIEMPDRYKSMFEESKEIYLSQLFAEGESFMNNENFAEAEKIFKEIKKLDPNYKNVAELKGVAIAEPKYRAGVNLFNQEKYRQAYLSFSEIEKLLPSYKDSKRYLEDCLLLGSFPLVIETFTNTSSNTEEVGSRISAFVTNAITNLNDPFIKVVDRKSLERIMEEQKLAMTGLSVGNNTVGELVAASASVSGSVIEFNKNEGRPAKSVQNGFERFTVKKLNSEGKEILVNEFRPVRYTEISQENSVSLSIQYQLVSIQTGQILFTDIVNVNTSDRMGYIAYQGNVNNLFPIAANGQVNTSNAAVSNLRNMAQGKRTILTVEKLSTELYRNAANKIAQDLRRKIESL